MALLEETRQPSKLNLFADLGPVVQVAWFVLEAVLEKLELKVDLIGQLDKLVKPDCITGSNPSSYKSSRMLEKVKLGNRAKICIVRYRQHGLNM